MRLNHETALAIRVDGVYRWMIITTLLVVLLSACSSGSSLTEEQEQWCWDNSAIVIDAAGDLGLFDLVDVYYEENGDGIGPDGAPELTTRNFEVNEELRKRNASDAEGLFDDLFASYLLHDDGQAACLAAYEEES